MTGGKVILDTNIIIELFAGNKPLAQQLFSFEKLLIPDVVIGELYVGVYHSGNLEKHKKILSDFLGQCDRATN